MEINNVQWKIGGEAGFGIMTTGLIFARVCSRGGLKVFAYPEYPSLIRGGHNTYQVAVHPESATSQIDDVHLLVALNKETVALQLHALVEGGALVYDPADFKETEGVPDIGDKNIVLVPVEMNAIIKERKANRIERNTLGIGASFALLDYPFELVESVIRDWFAKKKPEFVESNIELTKIGYESIAGKNTEFAYRLEAVEGAPKEMVVSGNTAAAMGAIKAGMKFYAAYPMTPSSDLLSFFAQKENDYKLVVKHTEDEIAAINMAIGAGFAGARAMTGTSGGGYALMTEAIGMAGIAEVPVVIVLGQRPGPSTGLPTWTSQGDLRFALHASQGEFPRIIVAPGDARECFYMTYEAFNLAEKYQLPVTIILDKYVQESWQSVEVFDTSELQIDRGKLLSQEELNALVANGGEYKRHEYTEDGISPRALPGMEGGRHIDSSYEHNEFGHTTEDDEETTKQMDKRFRKLERFLKEDVLGPEFFGAKDADITVVGWGSTKLTAMEMLRRAEAEGVSVNYLHFTYIDPLPIALVEAAFAKTKKTLMVEGNKLGQFEGWIREHTGITMDAHYRLYGGRPFYPGKMLEQVKGLQ